MSNNNPTKIVTGKVRISYEHLLKPYANQPGAEEKYSATLIIPKSDVVTKQKIDAAIAAAISAGVSGRWNGTRPPQVSIPVYDGDGVRPNGEAFAPECRGSWVITASSKLKPEVVDINLNPIMSASEVYSGMYARVSINFFAFFNSGKKGIGCGLNNVQKLEDGEPLGNRSTAVSDFGEVPSYQQPTYAPQPQYAAPQQPAYPQPQYAPAAPMYPQQSPTAIDPITGMPYGGKVLGL